MYQHRDNPTPPQTTEGRTTDIFPYVECAIGGANKRNDVRLLDEYSPNGYADCYRSMLRFPKAFAAYVEYNNGSVSGYQGESKADFFPADFDHEGDVSEALEDARRTVRRWEALYGLPPEALRYYYSGGKGFHIEIPENLFGGLEPGRATAARLKALAREMVGESKAADQSIYNTTRLYRTPNSKHGKTSLYKVPLYSREFFNLGIEEIQEIAKEPRHNFVYTDPGEFEPIPELARLWQRAEGAGPDNATGERLDTAAILNGVPKGERDTKLFKLASKLRGADVPQDFAERLVLEAAAKCDPPFPQNEALQKVANAYANYQPNDDDAELRIDPSPTSSLHSPLVPNEMMKCDNDIIFFSELGTPKPRKYILQDVAAKGYPLILFGAGGVAKSFATLQLGIGIAGDQDQWLGLDIVEHGSVLYLDFELDQDEQHRRVRDLCNGLRVAIPEQLAYLPAVGMSTENAFKKAYKFCHERQAVALVIDSIGIAMQGAMMKSEEVLSFHRKYIEPFMALGTSPFLVDHEGKLQTGESHQDKTPYGSAFKTWASRSVLQFQSEGYDKDTGILDIRIRHTKANFGPQLEPFGASVAFGLDKVTFDTRVLTKDELAAEKTRPAKQRTLEALAGGHKTAQEIADEIGVVKGTVTNILSDLSNLTPPKVEVKGREGNAKKYGLTDTSSLHSSLGENEMMKYPSGGTGDEMQRRYDRLAQEAQDRLAEGEGGEL